MGQPTSCLREKVEHVAFPVPRASSYQEDHPRLRFIRTSTLRVACMHYRCKSPASVTVLYAHGNATDIGITDEYLLTLSSAANIEIWSFDYPGYGLSSGTPTELSCLESIRAVYDHLTGVAGKREIILYGVSIGTGLCTQLAATLSQPKTLLACILQSPYTSAIGVVSQPLATSFAVCSPVVGSPDILNSLSVISHIDCSVYIYHGMKDSLISCEHAQWLHAKRKAEGKPSFLSLYKDGSHNDLGTDFERDICRLLRNLRTT